MKFPCPNCSETLEAAEEHQGLIADCGLCGGKFTVPTPPTMPANLGGLDPGELLARGLQSLPPLDDGGWEPPEPAELHRLLPQYNIEAIIGRGGMGVVYKGHQSGLDRAVAIKLLPSELTEDPTFVARFQREARTLARLEHPGVIHVYDYGQTSEGHLYFVMEFVDGTDLHHMIRGPGLNPAQALELIGQICDALQYAHSKGVVHRDIKPANILISLDGRVKLADFGLARPLQTGASGPLTLSRAIMGTPDYMAPEQKRGEGDHRVDLYALGVMLYEMLCGRTPQGAWQPPSQRVQVDIRLDQVVIKAMQEEPERRYQQASDVKTDVDFIRNSAIYSKAGKKAPPAPKHDKKNPVSSPQRAPGSSADESRTGRAISSKAITAGVACLIVILAAGAWFAFRPKATSASVNPTASNLPAAEWKPVFTAENPLTQPTHQPDAEGWINLDNINNPPPFVPEVDRGAVRFKVGWLSSTTRFHFMTWAIQHGIPADFSVLVFPQGVKLDETRLDFPQVLQADDQIELCIAWFGPVTHAWVNGRKLGSKTLSARIHVLSFGWPTPGRGPSRIRDIEWMDLSKLSELDGLELVNRELRDPPRKP